MEELVLSSGVTVRCEAVPLMATTEIIAVRPECRMPTPPVEVVKSRTGTTPVAAQPGTPEYAEWEREADAVRAARARIEDQAPFYLGVLEWKQVGQSKFSERVPKGWAFSRRLAALGVEPREGEDGRCWDYIVYELLKSPVDHLAVQRVVFGASAITEEEVAAVTDKFQGDAERPTDTETSGH